MTKRIDESDPLAGLRVPHAPAGLKERVLAAAAQRQPAVDHPWRRATKHPAVRVAWAASILLVAIVEGVAWRHPQPRVARSGAEPIDPELVAILELPRVSPGDMRDAGVGGQDDDEVMP